MASTTSSITSSSFLNGVTSLKRTRSEGALSVQGNEHTVEPLDVKTKLANHSTLKRVRSEGNLSSVKKDLLKPLAFQAEPISSESDDEEFVDCENDVNSDSDTEEYADASDEMHGYIWNKQNNMYELDLSTIDEISDINLQPPKTACKDNNELDSSNEQQRGTFSLPTVRTDVSAHDSESHDTRSKKSSEDSSKRNVSAHDSQSGDASLHIDEKTSRDGAEKPNVPLTKKNKSHLEVVLPRDHKSYSSSEKSQESDQSSQSPPDLTRSCFNVAVVVAVLGLALGLGTGATYIPSLSQYQTFIGGNIGCIALISASAVLFTGGLIFASIIKKGKQKMNQQQT